MSAVSCLHRVSGLLVPRASFADSPWMWQGWGCQCEPFAPVGCTDCYDGTLPNTLWVDMPALATGGCTYTRVTCADLAGTYELTKNGTCRWGWMTTSDGICCDYGQGCAGNIQADLLVYFGFCKLRVQYFYLGMYAIVWETLLSSKLSTIDHTLSYVSSATGVCLATGTSVDIYE